MSYSSMMYQSISIIILLALKKPECEFFSTRAIAEKLGIPTPTTVKILRCLIAGGIVFSKEGVKGGILLAKPAEKISLLDIFLALEQSKPLFNTGFTINFKGKQIEKMKKKVLSSLDDVEKEMKRSLGKMTIRDLIKT